MFYVYMIKSLSNPEQRYVSFTENLETRIDKHNDGGHRTQPF